MSVGLFKKKNSTYNQTDLYSSPVCSSRKDSNLVCYTWACLSSLYTKTTVNWLDSNAVDSKQ